ncbi:helix-turn-helix domain-containing protein [Streptomyces sp. NPDC002588]|uniref:helix-turn-helix domain-containing protein n=1 Tax=Streptomyces sp. NPDC002588 TaxID=3154419 RepID=UPI00331D920F
MSSGNTVVARNVRLLREQRGLSLAELARQARLAKQTLSNLEQGTGNPTVDTLFSIASALGVPVTRLVAEREQVMAVQRADEVVWQQHEGYESRSLDHVYGSGVIENYLVRIGRDPRSPYKSSEPHPVGTLEHLYVISGRVRVGPVDSLVELSAGDFVRYPGDRPHVYESLDGESLVHIVVSVPRVQPGTGGVNLARTHGGDPD